MTWVLVAVLIVSSILFLMQEILMAQDPLIPFKVMAKDGIGLACIMQTLLMFSLFAVSQAQCFSISISAYGFFPKGAIKRC